MVGKNGKEITLEQLAGVLEIFLSVGGRGSQPCKGLVQNGNDALLFTTRGLWKLQGFQTICRKPMDCGSACHEIQNIWLRRLHEIVQIARVNVLVRTKRFDVLIDCKRSRRNADRDCPSQNSRPNNDQNRILWNKRRRAILDRFQSDLVYRVTPLR